jgi:hypothetical protein
MVHYVVGEVTQVRLRLTEGDGEYLFQLRKQVLFLFVNGVLPAG